MGHGWDGSHSIGGLVQKVPNDLLCSVDSQHLLDCKVLMLKSEFSCNITATMAMHRCCAHFVACSLISGLMMQQAWVTSTQSIAKSGSIDILESGTM